MFNKKYAYSLKKYGTLYKITVTNIYTERCKLPSEWEESLEGSKPWPDIDGYIQAELPKKTDNNISRAKSKVYEYALSNNWDWFITLTIDKKKYNRYDLQNWYKDLSRWLFNYQKRIGSKIKYLLIPEMHSDGAWHLHGLISGIPNSHLEEFKKGTPEKLRKEGYKNWPAYAEKFGYCSLGFLKSAEAVSAYILKYIGKGLSDRKSDYGAHLFYSSKGLKTAEIVLQGELQDRDIRGVNFAFENEYVKTSYLKEGDLVDNDLFKRLLEDITKNG